MKRTASCFFVVCLVVCLSVAGSVLAGEGDPDAAGDVGTSVGYELMDLGSYDDGGSVEVPPLQIQRKPLSKVESPAKVKEATVPVSPDPLTLKKVSREMGAGASGVSPMVLPKEAPSVGSEPVLKTAPRQVSPEPAVAAVEMPSKLKVLEPVAPPGEMLRGSLSRGGVTPPPEIRLQGNKEKVRTPVADEPTKPSTALAAIQGSAERVQAGKGIDDSVASRMEIENPPPASLMDKKLVDIYERFYRK